MKTLDTKEWIAVVVAVSVVGFFFLFGPALMALFNQKNIPQNSMQNTTSTPQLLVKDEVVGTGDMANPGMRVTVHYTGRFVDGKVFDSSVTRGEPFQFILGSGQVIQGWDKGVVGMRVGGKRLLSVPPELGYGSQDYGPISANSTLMFEIELLKAEK